MLNEKALEAALEAPVAGGRTAYLRAAITVYLSALVPADVSALVERLEADATVVAPLGQSSGDGRWAAAVSLREAASLIQSQATESAADKARIAELEAAIRGLLDCPDIADNDHKDEETHAAERAARRAREAQGG